jgi:glycosyltransferase involved in cell wall biosynthesis
LGVGESARLAAKAIDTTSIGTALVPLKVNCLASREDHSLSSRLVEHNPYPINVFHIDAPQSTDIDHHHGENFRKGKRNIAYWAWELPDFPDSWMKYFKYYDEIWTPSNFVRDSVTMKSPLPVLTIPHCIDFETPQKPDREKFFLPSDKYLFLFAYDLNSYQPRKNPKATIRAFKKAFAGKEGQDVGLVIKTHSIEGNKEAFKELQSHLKGIENVYLIDRRLSREDVYNLMYSVDAYVSLHRAEGFGLTVAESMYLGKPVISTNWSATTEFLNQSNGCPVDFNLVELEKNFGPYTQGQIWADPSSEHAAELMRKLFKDRKFAKDLGEKAAIAIRNQFSPKIIGKIYEKRLKSFALW